METSTLPNTTETAMGASTLPNANETAAGTFTPPSEGFWLPIATITLQLLTALVPAVA